MFIRRVEEENAFSINKMVIPYKGIKAGSRRQYNPNKPSKWGFKNLVRAGVSGIIYDFLLYGGDDTFRGSLPIQKSLWVSEGR